MEKAKILEILSYATRAPSTHNSQPWLFKITKNIIEVYINPELFLPQADKEGRDLYISMGCMLENLTLAASAYSFSIETQIFINDNDYKIAHVILTNSLATLSSEDELLFKTIPMRVNARGVFNKNTLDSRVISILRSESVNFKKYKIDVSFIEEKKKIIDIALLTQKAMNIAYTNISFRKEMYHWMNSNLSFKKQGLPGYSLKISPIVSLIIPFLIRFFNIGPILGKKNFETLSSAPLLAVVSGPNLKESWIHIGRLSERLMLKAQSFGLQTSIYVGSIEMGDLYKEVQGIINTEERPQFLFAIGNIKGNHRVTPRHQIIKKIISYE